MWDIFVLLRLAFDSRRLASVHPFSSGCILVQMGLFLYFVFLYPEQLYKVIFKTTCYYALKIINHVPVQFWKCDPSQRRVLKMLRSKILQDTIPSEQMYVELYFWFYIMKCFCIEFLLETIFHVQWILCVLFHQLSNFIANMFPQICSISPKEVVCNLVIMCNHITDGC